MSSSPAKLWRSRILSLLSLGGVALLENRPAVKQLKTTGRQQYRSCVSIFKLQPWEPDDPCYDDGLLKICSFCKNEINEKNDIYMYSDQSFCSANCRYQQMIVDGFFKTISTKHAGFEFSQPELRFQKLAHRLLDRRDEAAVFCSMFIIA